MENYSTVDRDWARDEFYQNGGYDPWEKLRIVLGGYNSAVDIQAIQILECIQAGNHDADRTLGMSSEHVELFKYAFCSANWCEYGTSPRACWPKDTDEFQRIIDNWKAHLKIESGPDFNWEEAKLERWGYEHKDWLSPYYHYPSGGSRSPEPPEGSVRIA